jgi:hypothetical protein
VPEPKQCCPGSLIREQQEIDCQLLCSIPEGADEGVGQPQKKTPYFSRSAEFRSVALVDRFTELKPRVLRSVHPSMTKKENRHKRERLIPLGIKGAHVALFWCK